MVGGGWSQTEYSSYGLIPTDQHSVNVILPGALGWLELYQVSGQVGVPIVRSLPGEFDIPPILLQNFEVKWSFWDLLNDQVDAGVITSKSVGGHTGEESGVSPLCPLDADGGHPPVGDGLLPDGVSGVHLGVQPLVVHVPQDSNWLLSLGFTRQHSGLSFQGSLTGCLDLKRWRR